MNKIMYSITLSGLILLGMSFNTIAWGLGYCERECPNNIASTYDTCMNDCNRCLDSQLTDISFKCYNHLCWCVSTMPTPGRFETEKQCEQLCLSNQVPDISTCTKECTFCAAGKFNRSDIEFRCVNHICHCEKIY